MGMLRKAIVLGGLLYLLPSPPVGVNVADEPSVQPSTMATIYAATETVADAKSFCERRPQVCVTGYYILSKAEAKAKYSAQLAYEWFNQPAQSTVAVAHVKPAQAPLRVATLNEPKPTTINDLLSGSEE